MMLSYRKKRGLSIFLRDRVYTKYFTLSYNLPDGWLNQHIFKVTANEYYVSKDYLYYVLKYLKPHFTQIATNKQTTGLGHVTIADIKRMSVVVPSHEVQSTIVDVLKPIDDKIQLNNEINDNLAA